jgi:hypothetical protein
VELAIRESHLQQGMCWAEDKDGRKSLISVRFAEYYRATVPPERKIIEARWHFGPDGKLQDISLDYFHTGIYGIFMTKENEQPISLSDYRK